MLGYEFNVILWCHLVVIKINPAPALVSSGGAGGLLNVTAMS